VSGFGTPFPLFVAQRYLRSTRRDAFITFLSLTAAGGIALGVAALILSSAALTGFQAVLRDEVLRRSPHMEVALPVGAQVSQAALSAVPGVETVRSSLRGRGWLVSTGRARPVEVIGYEGALPDQFPGAANGAPGLYVSDRLASGWGLESGQVIEVVSAHPTLTPMGPQPRVRRLDLSGTFTAGRTEQEERIAVPIADSIHLFGSSELRLLVMAGSLGEVDGVADRLEQVLPEGSVVRTWEDLNRALLFLLRLEKTLMFVAVFLIVVVASMAVISDLMLILAHKQAEMGMLGAMGAQPASLRRIFLWLGALLVGVGVTMGGLLGICGAWILERYQVLSLPGDVYFLDHVPFLVRPLEVGVILLATVGLTLACSWIAASRAASLRPIETLNR
jgi:lipoprotein-releasing system permease protein